MQEDKCVATEQRLQVVSEELGEATAGLTFISLYLQLIYRLKGSSTDSKSSMSFAQLSCSNCVPLMSTSR